MKFAKHFLWVILLVVTTAAMAEEKYRYQIDADLHKEHAEWLKCQTDDDCLIAGVVSCGYKFAVNKNYSDQAKDFVQPRTICEKSYELPPNSVAKCFDAVCAIRISIGPQEQSGFIPAPPPPTGKTP